MEHLAPFNPDGKTNRFELWARLEEKWDGTKADWCRLFIGPQAENTLNLIDAGEDLHRIEAAPPSIIRGAAATARCIP